MSNQKRIEAFAVAAGIKPKADNILLIRDEADDSIGVILLPDQAKERPCRGTVLATGPGMVSTDTGESLWNPNYAKQGDHVLFTKYGGVVFTHKGHEFVMVSQSHILATLDD